MGYQRRHMLVLLLVVVAGLARDGAGSEAFFVPLGSLPGGAVHSVAYDVSADGSLVVGRSSTTDGTEAFRWTAAAGMVGLGDLPGGAHYSDAKAVSADGLTIVGRSSSWNSSEGWNEAFRWTAGGMQGLGDLPGWPFGSNATDVSADGSVVVGAGYPGRIGPSLPEAFRWTWPTGMVSLGGFLPGVLSVSVARAVSPDGSVVVGWSNADDGREAFRWTEQDGMIALGELAGGQFNSEATRISADGSVIIGESISGLDPNGQYLREVFRWTEQDGMVGLGFYGFANGTTPDGSVIVGTLANSAYIWDQAHGQRTLDDVLTGLGVDMGDWQTYMGYGVSADGNTIVGVAYPTDGHLEGFIAHIPEPSAFWLLTVGALTAMRRRRDGC